MRPFQYRLAPDPTSWGAAGTPDVQFLAGGTTLLDLMKLGVMAPGTVIDINRLRSGPAGQISATLDGGLRLGALVTMADAARNEEVARRYPLVAASLAQAASVHIRNMASLGGNLLQRTRCPYFRDPSWPACNKRVPGSGCSALQGVNRMHAILGGSSACVATYPGDLAVALVGLDATIEIQSTAGPRSIGVRVLHRQPGETPEQETRLVPGELIAAIHLPPLPWARRSVFLKVRDRQSYEFALSSAAVALDLQEGNVRDSRIALGGIATIPWRATEAEEMLRGKPFTRDNAEAAAEAALSSARPLAGNAFKVELARRTIVAALGQAAAMEL